jgi:hypothetical protein
MRSESTRFFGQPRLTNAKVFGPMKPFRQGRYGSNEALYRKRAPPGKASRGAGGAQKVGPADHEDAANLAIRTGPISTVAAESLLVVL